MRNPTDSQAAAEPAPDAEARADAAEAALEAQLRQQHALSQGLAHDLRAPLRAIDSFAVLAGQHASGIDDAGRDYLQRIRDSAARMGAMLDSLQELSSAGRAPLRLEQVDLGMLAEWVGAELQDAHPGRAAQIQVRPGLSVQGDEHYLKRMLAQLMDNAWKFSAPRERVEIDVEGEQTGEIVHLRVRDRGIGFDMQYAGKLFEPFQRLHGVDEGAGAGLGLVIAQCIAQRHGGRIHAESVAGTGSVFHIELPAVQEGATRDG
jgi:signal transduction histidine kinase